jgi:release factor glutamine methyltransferase
MTLLFSEFRQYLRYELNEIYTQPELTIIEKLLIEKFCGVSWPVVLISQNEHLHDLHLGILRNAVQKLKMNMPVEYVTGYVEFCDLKLWVNDSVLIPRPETEELVEYIRNYFKGKLSPQFIIDFCTGSGCIAIALKKSFPEATVYATDISKSALHTARYNANLHGFEVEFLQHDLLTDESLPFEYDVDIIVSNPPYVTVSELYGMQERVKDYEPHNALFAPEPDPLKFYHHLKDFALRYLKPGGCFMFELNEKYHENVKEIFQWYHENITDLNVIRDSFGKERFLFGVKKSVR